MLTTRDLLTEMMERLFGKVTVRVNRFEGRGREPLGFRPTTPATSACASAATWAHQQHGPQARRGHEQAHAGREDRLRPVAVLRC